MSVNLIVIEYFLADQNHHRFKIIIRNDFHLQQHLLNCICCLGFIILDPSTNIFYFNKNYYSQKCLNSAFLAHIKILTEFKNIKDKIAMENKVILVLFFYN